MSKFKRLLTPLAVMCLVCALAIMAPITSIVGALRVSVAATVNTTLDVSNLPARYQEIGAAIDKPTVSGGEYELRHAGRKIEIKDGSKYDEVGRYDWVFKTADGKVFDTYTVYVTQPEYTITMPSVVATMAPKDTDLILPMPEKITKDGEEITAGTDGYELTLRVSMGSDSWDFTAEDDQFTIPAEKLDRVGTLKVTYVLEKDGKLCAAKLLSDIEIKNIDTSKVTFTSNPSAPSVSSLTYRDEIELSNPSMGDAKYENTTFTPESWTNIIAVKYSENQPSNWNNVTSIKVTADNISDYVKIDGLKVSVQKLGWYKFQFETTTLFGNVTEAKDDEDGKYWSDAVQIKRDSTAPEFKWVEAYDNKDEDKVAALFAGFDDLAGDDDYSRYLPDTTLPDVDAKGVTVTDAITFPAMIARDNGTDTENLVYTITIKQLRDGSGATIKDSGNTKTISSTAYEPNKNLVIQFDKTSDTTATDSGNIFHMNKVNGLYSILFQVRDVQPDGSTSSSGNTTSKTYYFSVNDKYVSTDNAPTINPFYVSDVYLWEGNTFKFKLPTYSDEYTETSNIRMDYYLVNGDDEARLDPKNISNGYMTVDLDDLYDENGNKIDFDYTTKDEYYIYAVARNFNNLQMELTDIDNSYVILPTTDSGSAVLDRYPDNTSEKGKTYRYASFKIHGDSANQSATISLTYDDDNLKVGEKVTLTELKTTWGSTAVDGRVSISVYYLAEDGNRSAVDVYNEDDEIVSTVLFNDKTNIIQNWYFTPSNSGDYQIVVNAKANDSASSTYLVVDNLNVKAGSGIEVINPFATASTTFNDALTLGETGTLPNYTIKVSGKDAVIMNRKVYAVSDLNTPIGNYTVTLKNVNDPDCVIGNKFSPNKTGTYKFQYDITCNTGETTSFIYAVSVTEASETSSILMDQHYGEYYSERYGYNVIEVDNADEGSEITKAIALQEFILSNKGGALNFTVSRAFLQANLEEDANSDYYVYPAIAIPMPNIVKGQFTSDDVTITVQKSGSTDYLVSSKLKNINGTASKLGTIDGYYVFRPDGKFTGWEGDFMTTAVDKNEANAVYLVTYSLPDDTSLTFNVTIGEPEVGALEFDFDGFLTYKDGSKTKNINNDNTTPVIDKDSDGKKMVTIDLTKVNYDGKNANFMDLIAKGLNPDDDSKTDAEKIQEYIWKNAEITVYIDGAAKIWDSDWNLSDVDGLSKDDEAMTRSFDVATYGSGTYKIEVRLENPYTNSYATQTFEFTIDTTATNRNIDLSTVWGIILIVLAVGLLAGVIFYFVKTARETKFLDTPKAPKKDKKDKKAKTEDKKTADKVADQKVADKKVEDKK